MNIKRVRAIAASLAGLLLLYALVGFFALPALVKNRLLAYVESDLGHALTLGEVRFNPFTLAAEVTDLDLRESSGGALVSFKRLFVNFQASSVFARAWTFAEVTLESPAITAEARTDGSTNFSALLAALRKPQPEPERPPPPLHVERIRLTDGRVALADLRAGETARLTLAPIAFELTELSTLPSERAPYSLSARTTDAESIRWDGEISLNPMASSGKLSLQGWQVATLARLLGNRIALDKAAGQIDAQLDYRMSYTDGVPNLVLADSSWQLAGLSLVGKAASIPLATAATFKVAGVSMDLAKRTASIDQIELVKPTLALTIGHDGQANWDALLPRVRNAVQGAASAPEPSVAPAPAAAVVAENVAASPASPWRIELARVAIADMNLAFSDQRPDSAADVAVERARLDLAGRLSYGNDGLDAAIDKVTLGGGGTRIARGNETLSIGDFEASVAGLKSTLAGSRIELAGDSLAASLASLGVRQGENDWRSQRVSVSGQAFKLALAETGTRAEGSTLKLESTAIGGRAGGAAKDVIGLASVSLSAQSLAVVASEKPLAATVEGLGAAVAGLVLSDPATGGELARLAKFEASGGTLASADRRVSIERVAVTDGHAAASVSAHGKSNWDGLLGAFGVASAEPGAAKKPVSSPAEPQWTAVAKAIEVRNFGAQFSDPSRHPPVAVALHDVNAKASNVSTDRAAEAHIELGGRINDGGRFSAAGRVNLQTLAADVKVKLTDLSLLPAQFLVAQHARLQLVSALASAEGRVRYRQPKAGADLVFEGELGLSKVNVEETEPVQPFLSLDTLSARQVKLTLAPNRLEIPDMRVNALATKLLIAEDQSVNFVKVLRRSPQTEPAAPAGTTKPNTAPDDEQDPFPLSVARIRFDNSALEFSDLSLVPQFATRMHELQGVITGLSSQPGSPARLELDARIDEFGSAQIRGTINPFQPRRFTNVDMVFRNIEMTALTPYAAKFAGYRIASGQLSMDLQYRIKNSALTGKNRIVVDKLELGERVDSPSALDLPLTLAIAILQDENGRIDIGLPVSGSLEDPQFSIAGIVWKAIGSLLTRVVTAPFRALASLFGGSDTQQLDSIEFDPGMARLLPPERQKLRTVAEALQKRPQLKLTVNPTYSATADREMLQSLAVRSAIITEAGIKLEPGEAPGPLDYSSERIQQAIEAVFSAKFGAAEARALRAGLEKKSPTPAGPEATKPKPEAAARPPRVARAMAQRLIEANPVNDSELTALAQRRGEAIASELRDAGKIDPARVATGSPKQVDSGEGRTIVSTLDLAVIK